MRQYPILLKKNTVNCLLFLGILRLDNLACLENVCIFFFYCLCYVKDVYTYMSEDQVSEERDMDLNEEEDIRLGAIR